MELLARGRRKEGGGLDRWRPQGQIGFTRKGGAELTREKSLPGKKVWRCCKVKMQWKREKDGEILELVERKRREEIATSKVSAG